MYNHKLAEAIRLGAEKISHRKSKYKYMKLIYPEGVYCCVLGCAYMGVTGKIPSNNSHIQDFLRRKFHLTSKDFSKIVALNDNTNLSLLELADRIEHKNLSL